MSFFLYICNIASGNKDMYATCLFPTLPIGAMMRAHQADRSLCPLDEQELRSTAESRDLAITSCVN